MLVAWDCDRIALQMGAATDGSARGRTQLEWAAPSTRGTRLLWVSKNAPAATRRASVALATRR